MFDKSVGRTGARRGKVRTGREIEFGLLGRVYTVDTQYMLRKAALRATFNTSYICSDS
jgi:hypothetical protein